MHVSLRYNIVIDKGQENEQENLKICFCVGS